MDKNYTPEKLNELSKEALVLMVLSMQEQLASVNAKLDKLTEQIAIANNYRFGRLVLCQVFGQVKCDLFRYYPASF